MSKGRKIQNGPPSATKQMVWRRYKTGLYDVMLVFDQKLIKNDAFDLQEMMRNPVEFYEFWFSVTVIFLTDFGRIIHFAG